MPTRASASFTAGWSSSGIGLSAASWDCSRAVATSRSSSPASSPSSAPAQSPASRYASGFASPSEASFRGVRANLCNSRGEMPPQGHAVARPPVADWFARRSYEHNRFRALEPLARRKLELALKLSIVLPCREVAGTIGAISDEIHALNEEAPLVDQVVAIDAGSADGTAEVARRHGLEVYSEDELVPELGPALGKGDAMWRALSVVRGDLVM